MTKAQEGAETRQYCSVLDFHFYVLNGFLIKILQIFLLYCALLLDLHLYF